MQWSIFISQTFMLYSQQIRQQQRGPGNETSGILREKENYENDGGDYDMCQALLDMMEDSKAQGISIGEARGISIGESRGIQLAKEVIGLQMAGKSAEEIAAICQIPAEKVEEILR